MLEPQQYDVKIPVKSAQWVGSRGSLAGGSDGYGGGRGSSGLCGSDCRSGGSWSSTGGVAADGHGVGANVREGALETSRFAIDGEVPAPTAVGEQEQADGAMSDR